MAKDTSKPGYQIKHVDGTTSPRTTSTRGEETWRNIIDMHRPADQQLVRLAQKIQQHEMFPYVKIGKLMHYAYIPPDSKDVALRRAMKVEALKFILSSLDGFYKGKTES